MPGRAPGATPSSWRPVRDWVARLAQLQALSAVYPSARMFSAQESAVDDVLAAVEGSDIAHLACHGTFRVDNPMFSSLRLADGAMTVFDLEKLRRAPRLVVLAACDVGTAAVSAGDELLGLSAALRAPPAPRRWSPAWYRSPTVPWSR